MGEAGVGEMCEEEEEEEAEEASEGDGLLLRQILLVRAMVDLRRQQLNKLLLRRSLNAIDASDGGLNTIGAGDGRLVVVVAVPVGRGDTDSISGKRGRGGGRGCRINGGRGGRCGQGREIKPPIVIVTPTIFPALLTEETHRRTRARARARAYTLGLPMPASPPST